MEKEKEIVLDKKLKVVFKLEQDEDGYPPFAYEGLWAKSLGNDVWELDNAPFFVYEISNKDRVVVEKIDNELRFQSVRERGGHSTLRIHFEDESKVHFIREELKKLGCPTEGSNNKNLVSVDVPKIVNLSTIESFLKINAQKCNFEYEHGCNQHHFDV